MAPGGPWDQKPGLNAPNGATATHLVTCSILGPSFVQKHVVFFVPQTQMWQAACGKLGFGIWRIRVWDLAN